MKWLNQISIKVKVMLPICILGIVILLASISSLVNSKRLLQAGVVISQDCSKSIELLMDMSSELESMGKICMDTVMRKILFPKKALQQPSMKSWNLWIVILNSIKNRKKQRGKKNISGHYKIALKSIKKEWNRSLPQVQKAMRWCNGGNQCDTETFGRLSCKENQQSDCYAETGNE